MWPSIRGEATNIPSRSLSRQLAPTHTYTNLNWPLIKNNYCALNSAHLKEKVSSVYHFPFEYFQALHFGPTSLHHDSYLSTRRDHRPLSAWMISFLWRLAWSNTILCHVLILWWVPLSWISWWLQSINHPQMILEGNIVIIILDAWSQIQ